MPRDGRIIDIRYFGPDDVDLEGPLRALRGVTWVGDRICRKAREYGLKLGKQDHVYFQLFPEPPYGTVSIITPAPASARLDFFHRVAVRLDPATLEGQNQTQLEDILAEITFRGLSAVTAGADEAALVIDRVKADLASKRRELEVECYARETKRHRVRVHHQLSPLRQGPLAPIGPKHTLFATLEYEDKVTGWRGATKILDFDAYDELHSAIGTVSVRGDVITIRPRRGHAFGVAIETPISALTPLE